MQRRRAAREGQGAGDFDPLGQFALEGVYVRAHGGDPVGVERLEEKLPLFVADVRWGQVDPAHGSGRGSGTREPVMAAAATSSTATTAAATTAGAALRATAAPRAIPATPNSVTM